MVPVISKDGKALMPTSNYRAAMLMKRGDAKPYYQKGIFCIKLVNEEKTKRCEYPEVVLGIDPGSKREGYTVATSKGVVLNITSNTPDWVKSHIETRRNLRRSRRQRKTPRILFGETVCYYLFADGTLTKNVANRSGRKFDSFNSAVVYLKRAYDLKCFD